MNVIVEPKHARGANRDPLALLTLGMINRGPRWEITCGQCGLAFESRLPMVDEPAVKCPFCDAINVLHGLVVRR